MKKIKEKNDDLFNNVETIRVDGANFGCNGEYEKIKDVMNL